MDEETLRIISDYIKRELDEPPDDRVDWDHLLGELGRERDRRSYTYTLPSHGFTEEYLYEYGQRYLYSGVSSRVHGTRVVVKFVENFIRNANLLQRTSQFYKIADPCFDWVEFLIKRFFESCFVVELFRKYAMVVPVEVDDPIFNKPQNRLTVQCYLTSKYDELPPLFVLVEFFNLTKNQDNTQDNFIDLVLHFFKNMVGPPLNPSLNNHSEIQIDESKPLVDLVHKAFVDPDAAQTSISMERIIELHFINYATELQEAGVKFKRMEGNNLEIKFQNGVLEIPPIKVAENTTLCLLQTLTKYERDTFPADAPKKVNDYVKFIHCLINSPKDVELLRHSGIIENWLGNDQLIFDKLIELGNESKISLGFTYSGIFKKVNEHCGHRRNVWMANLRRNYFNSPWSFVSFLAAVVLLLLTLTQTVFSILSYHPS
ncbi:UPF0481 protein [Camellia lanceoleosa]|uniref:UPF0481 protein n=1 Tax=Camellia lanceoleosa TaxID=1840588 RepID=A0ACC0J064_9ERIC|nr:UPF0481 protein [Camellia lanceoleosa]